MPATRLKDSSANLKKTISLIENYLEHAKDNENALEFLPFWKLSENNDGHIR